MARFPRASILSVEALEDRLTPAVKLFAVGADAGGAPHVIVYNTNGTQRFSFYAYSPSFTGGVRVATGDVNGDGTEDIVTMAGPGGAAHVQVFSGVNLAVLSSFYAFAPSITTGGRQLAAADANGDGRADVFTMLTSGANSTIRVYDGLTTGMFGNFGTTSSFNVEATMAAADVNNDGQADVLVAQPVAYALPGGGVYQADLRSYTFAGAGIGASLFWQVAFPDGFGGYVFANLGQRQVAVGEMTGDGVKDVAMAQGSQLQIRSGATGLNVYNGQPYGAGVSFRLGLEDVNGDGRQDVITGVVPGFQSHVKVFDAVNGQTYHSFFAFGGFTGGVYVG